MDGPAIDGYIPQEICRGRGRHRQNAVGAADGAAAHMHRGGDHLVRRQLLHQQAHRRHVRHGVHGAHFMEMNVRHRHAVDVTLRLGNAVVHRPDVRPHLFRHRQVADQMADLLHAAVVMVVLVVMLMVMVMLVVVVVLALCVAVHRHDDVRCR